MELLKERGTLDNYPKVHAFNTFFYPKITSGGHSAVRRWTRKVDVFAVDYILIPVHLGMHWCLAVSYKKILKVQNTLWVLRTVIKKLKHTVPTEIHNIELIKPSLVNPVIVLGGRLSKERNKILRFYGRQK